MLLITGGAGFIGSVLHAALVERGETVIICDWLQNDDKWRNLASHVPARIIAPEDLAGFLETEPALDVVFHLGAISATTARDGDLVWRTNVALSQSLWQYCTEHKVRLIYASSAATYGRGEHGFDDDFSLDYLSRLRPLNLYGWSKHVFDSWVSRIVHAGGARPPQWAGLKFFNVYGPNEYHKGSMISVVKVKHDEVKEGRKPRLFRSDSPGLADGDQKRDFIWVGDVVDVMLWLYDNPKVSGLFNVGSGTARTYLALAHAVCDAAEVPRAVEFIDMPPALKGQYQDFTEASTRRLRDAGYARPFTPLEEGVGIYIRRYLATPQTYL